MIARFLRAWPLAFVALSLPAATPRPNILFIVSEDNGPELGDRKSTRLNSSHT